MRRRLLSGQMTMAANSKPALSSREADDLRAALVGALAGFPRYALAAIEKLRPDQITVLKLVTVSTNEAARKAGRL